MRPRSTSMMMSAGPSTSRARTDGTANLLDILPDDTLVRIITLIELSALPPFLGALRLTSSEWRDWMDGEASANLWHGLLPLMASTTPRGARRTSERLVLSPQKMVARAWKSILSRSEALHHALAIVGQDKKNLTLKNVKTIIKRFGPATLIDRSSPVYNATLLMEVCKARRTREANQVACVNYLIKELGADVNARQDGANGLSPLIIAAARGLPSLVKALLECGADSTRRGEGRFRLCAPASHKTHKGCYTALEWVETLYKLEKENGVPTESSKPLWQCLELLRSHE